MAGKRRFEEQLAALEQLRHEPPQAAIGPLRKALSHQSNYIVAKAADLVREFRLAELIPELLVAFDRCFANPLKTDPQCWAKNAISRALAALEFQDARSTFVACATSSLSPSGAGVPIPPPRCGRRAPLLLFPAAVSRNRIC